MPKLTPIPTPILISDQIPKPLKPIKIPEPILVSILETNFGPTIWNHFQKTSELARIDSDANFIFPITRTNDGHHVNSCKLAFVPWDYLSAVAGGFVRNGILTPHRAFIYEIFRISMTVFQICFSAILII